MPSDQTAELSLVRVSCASKSAGADCDDCAGRALQGGYNLEATAAGVEACMRVCLGERPPPLRPEGRELPAPSAPGLAAIREALILQVPPGSSAGPQKSATAAAMRVAETPSEVSSLLRL